MRTRHLVGIVAIALCTLASQAVWAGDRAGDRAGDADGIFASLRKEMDRNMKGLHLAGAPKPYFFGVLYRRSEGWSQTASLGKLYREGDGRSASLSGSVRVGNYDKDDTNFYGAYPATGSSGASVDGDQLVLRRAAHTAWDSAYKRAVQLYAKKETYLANHPKAKRCADWSRTKVQGWSRIDPPKTLSKKDTLRLILEASAVFRKYPGVIGSGVSFGLFSSESFLLTSEGLRAHELNRGASVGLVASGQAKDGQWIVLRWGKMLGLDEIDLAHLKLVERAKKMAERLKKLLAAPLFDETYNGPVLLEGAAAASLWTTFVAKGLRADMPPVAWASGRMIFEGMKGRRILPTSVSIVDDPTATRYRGKKLYGHYTLDDEGMPARKLVLVDRGKLKGFLASRRPSVETNGSNGHGRSLYGLSLAPTPNGSNVFIKVRRALSSKALRRKYFKMLRKEGLDHGYIIRSFGGAGLDSRGFVSYGTRPTVSVPAPLEIYRVDLKGHEQLVRKVQIQPIQMADFASIPAIGGPERVITVRTRAGRGVSLVYRDFILSRMSFTRPPAGERRLPTLPSPLQRLLHPSK